MSGRSGTATCAQGANPSAIKRGRRLPYCLLLIALLLGAAILKRTGARISPPPNLAPMPNGHTSTGPCR